ncbi:hypothetical protein [Haloarcula sediminis]|nr:hypothetical protein [Haloarcula sp. CK38]
MSYATPTHHAPAAVAEQVVHRPALGGDGSPGRVGAALARQFLPAR